MIKQKYQTTKKLTKEVIEEIITLEKKEGLTAENLLKKAKSKKNVLHNFFEWDDSEAATKWRIHQARLLINEIKIIVEDKIMYAMENVSVICKDGTEKREYRPIFEILSNKEQRKQLIERALANQEYWVERNKIYSELKPIVMAIEKTSLSLNKKWQKKKK